MIIRKVAFDFGMHFLQLTGFFLFSLLQPTFVGNQVAELDTDLAER